MFSTSKPTYGRYYSISFIVYRAIPQLTSAQRKQCARRILAFQVVLYLREGSQDPAKGTVTATNQNAELLHVTEGIETRNGTTVGQVIDLVGIEVSSEGREKLHPLVTTALPVDKD